MNKTIECATAGTGWQILGANGTGYADIATMRAAGVEPWPNLDPGGMLQSLTVKTRSGTSNGSGVYVATSRSAAPAAGDGFFVQGGDIFSIPGFAPGVSLERIANVWFKKVGTSDTVCFTGNY